MSNKQWPRPRTAAMPNALDPNEWLTPDYIAQDLQVSMSTWYQWRTAGKAPKAIKVGKHVRVRRSDYEAWLATLGDVPGAR